MVPYHGATFDGMFVHGMGGFGANELQLPLLSASLALLQTLPAFFGAKRGEGRTTANTARDDGDGEEEAGNRPSCFLDGRARATNAVTDQARVW